VKKITKHILSLLIALCLLLPLASNQVIANPITGTIDLGGAPWTLENYLLVVEPGVINRNAVTSPWDAYRYDIDNIIFDFDEPDYVGPGLRSLFNGLLSVHTITGLEHFDTSGVVNMSSMFEGTSSLECIGDISGWYVDYVTNFNSMFRGASNLVSLDLSSWNVSSAENMGAMFRYMNSLTSIGDLSKWNTSNVTNMNAMFLNASSLTSVGNLSEWNTGNVTNMAFMFSGASSLTALDLSYWDTSSVTNMDGMFRDTNNLQCIGNVSGWDTSSVTNMHRMFRDAASLTELDLSGWNTSNVTNMAWTFRDASSLIKLDLYGWDTSNVTDMSNMFTGATTLRQLTLGTEFNFVGGTAASLPSVPSTAPYTGHWQNIGNGTIYAPKGDYVLTSAELMNTFDGATMADTWVWQRQRGIAPLHDHIFPPTRVGYGAQIAHEVTVTSTGMQPTGELTITLSGQNPNSFTISQISLASISSGNTASFTVVPNTGLTAGMHTAVVTVFNEDFSISAYFTVTFTVLPALILPPLPPTPEPTLTPTTTPVPTPTLTPIPEPMPTPLPTPTTTPVPMPTLTPAIEPTLMPTLTPTPEPTSTLAPMPTPTAAPIPIEQPIESNSPPRENPQTSDTFATFIALFAAGLLASIAIRFFIKKFNPTRQ